MEKKLLLKKIPKVDTVQNSFFCVKLLDEFSKKTVLTCIRNVLDEIRKNIIEEKINNVPSEEEINIMIKNNIEKYSSFSLKKVINATGIVLHTNFGRANLPEEAAKKVYEISKNYSNLEYDLLKGERGERYIHINSILKEMFDIEEAIVVNNNAAAVFLILSTLTKNKNVLVSRGELVEIGGSFRIPDIMRESNTILKEVGTTNKTHLSDYENNIDEETKAILKVHTSNFKIIGFNESPSIIELKKIANKHNIPLIFDLGSGLFYDLSKIGIYDEINIYEAIKSGVDILCFSGDKLLGASQAGIIMGKKKYIDQIKKNPLMRAFRVDKMTLMALEATLRVYRDDEDYYKKIPTLKMINKTYEEIKKEVNYFLKMCKNISDIELDLIDDESEVGGGSLPGVKLKTVCLSIKKNKLSVNDIEKKFRLSNNPIIGRIKNNNFLLDFRTIEKEDYNIIKEEIIKLNK
ncbi:MAG: L-seryl-tRNA(Sec) selenium transferase [Eubacteriales bacterium]|nr:L-seryl-tRNA(Sec) selenium transferase [Eubacteriales bacterium]